MATITPNTDYLLNLKKTYGQNNNYMSDFFSFMLANYSQSFTIQTYDELYDYLFQAMLQNLANHTASEKMRAKDPDKFKKLFDKPQIAELVYFINYFIPTHKISLDGDTYSIATYEFLPPKEGTYNMDIEAIYTLIYKICPNTNKSEATSYFEALSKLASIAELTTNKNIIVVNNGLYNRRSKKIKPFTPAHITVSKIATNYNEHATNPIITNPDGSLWDIDSWIKDLAGTLEDDTPDKETETLFWQLIHATINPGNINGKAVFFYAPSGNNGKGTFGSLLKNLVGKGNYSSLPIKAFNHEFMKEQLIGKTLNIADENPVDTYIDDVMDFKAYITGDDILINRKHKKVIGLNAKAINIQMLNGFPKTRDKSDSFYRRFIIVYFKKSFTNNGENYLIKDDYIKRQDVLEYVLKKALELKSFTDFIVPKRSTEAMNLYKESNNSVIEFWNEFENQFVWTVLPLAFLYDLYKSWFMDANQGSKFFNKNQFTTYLVKHINENSESKYSATKLEEKKNIRVNKHMDADEPLITQFNLTKYYNLSNPNTTNLKTKRDFTRPEFVRGLIKKEFTNESEVN